MGKAGRVSALIVLDLKLPGASSAVHRLGCRESWVQTLTNCKATLRGDSTFKPTGLKVSLLACAMTCSIFRSSYTNQHQLESQCQI